MKNINYYLELLRKKSIYTYNHCLRVSYYSRLIGIAINLSNDEMTRLINASLLHDIGKLFIPEDILNKKQKLTNRELNIIKKHTLYVKEILNNDYDDIINDIICHHERLDGSGYPYHLKNISLNARIIAIADSFDAMTSNRGYNMVLSYEQAFLELFKCSDFGMYDRELIMKFYENFNNNLYISKQKNKTLLNN